jgi:hypothetical protein
MKKVLLSFFLCSIILVASSQTSTSYPCVKFYASGNVGGGDCDTKGSGNNKHYPGYLTELENVNYTPTGKITIYFQSPIPVGTPAPLITAAGVDAGGGIIQLPVFDYKYAAYHDNTTIARSSVVYCYYGSASNQNIFNGSRAPSLAFKIAYPGNPNTDQICGGVVELPVTLPVSMKSFAVARNNQSVSIKWETAIEQNNKGFYVQRNVNGEWKDIAFVFSKADYGNSSQVLSYSYNDPNNLKTVSYYRILQVDLDNRGKFSEVRTVRGLDELNKLMLFPNPGTNGKINLLFQDETAAKNIIVYDATGRVIKSFKNIVSANLTIDQLKPGMYNIQVINTISQIITSDKFIIRD